MQASKLRAWLCMPVATREKENPASSLGDGICFCRNATCCVLSTSPDRDDDQNVAFQHHAELKPGSGQAIDHRSNSLFRLEFAVSASGSAQAIAEHGIVVAFLRLTHRSSPSER
jgi:hypothetical protein